MDDRTTEEELKEKLEPHLKIPKDYFKLEENLDESGSYSSCSKVSFKEDRKYSIGLGRIVHSDEERVDVLHLDMNNLEVHV